MTSKLKVNLINDSGDNNLITSDGSGSVTLGTAFPAVGKIGQVATTTFTLDANITSTSLAELNASCRVSLTPNASTSKFLFQVQFPYYVANSNTGFFINFYRDIGGGGYSDISGELSRYAGYGSATGKYQTFSAQFLDSPSTASAVTYSPYVKVSANTVNFGNNGKYSAILMEVLA
tara:strand:+ start:278 stop:805 length:528 start_codon:yes stop_codon:yes gene_type:complete